MYLHYDVKNYFQISTSLPTFFILDENPPSNNDQPSEDEMPPKKKFKSIRKFWPEREQEESLQNYSF